MYSMLLFYDWFAPVWSIVEKGELNFAVVPIDLQAHFAWPGRISRRFSHGALAKKSQDAVRSGVDVVVKHLHIRDAPVIVQMELKNDTPVTVVGEFNVIQQIV